MKNTFLLRIYFLCIGLICIFVWMPASGNAQFKSTLGPPEAFIYKFFNTNNACFASTGNGLYKIEFNSDEFIRCEIGVDFYETIGFAADKNELFLSYLESGSDIPGFVYSNDNGDSWTQRPLFSKNWYSFEFAYKNGILLSLDDQGKVIQSIDSGFNWTQESIDNTSRYFNLLRSNSSYFFAASYDKLYRRAIDGGSWEPILTLPAYFFDIHVTDSVIIILPDRKVGFVSYNNGNDWARTTITGYNGDYSIADFGDKMYYNDLDKLFKSTNKGLTWSLIKEFDFNSSLLDVWKLNNRLIGSVYDFGLVESADEFQSEKRLVKGLNAAYAHNLAIRDSFLYTITNSSLYKYNLFEKKWKTESLIPAKQTASLHLTRSNTFLTSTSPYEIVSFNDKDNLIKIETINNNSFQSSSNETNLTYEYNNNILLCQGNAIAISYNGGKNWAFSLFDKIKFPYYTRSITIFKDSLLVAAIDNNTNKLKFLITKDLINWLDFYVKDFSKLPSEYPLLVSDHNLLLLAYPSSFYTRMYKFDEITSSFIKVKGLDLAFDNALGHYAKIISLSNNKYLFNTTSALYISDDTGLSWHRVIDEFYRDYINAHYDLVLNDSCLFYSTYPNGVLEQKISDLTGSKFTIQTYYDKNQNLVYDSGDETLNGSYVRLGNLNKFIPSNSNGIANIFYNLKHPDTLKTIDNFKYGQFIPIESPLVKSISNYDFAFQIPSGINDVSISMYEFPKARPGFDYYVYLVVRNNGSEDWNGDLEFNYDQIFQYIGSSVNPSILTSGFLKWSIGSIRSLEQIIIQVKFILPTKINIGTTFTHSSKLINNSIIDLDLTDNIFEIQSEVVGSCDPNEISVNKSRISKKEFENGTELTYKVKFQNTGNYPADFVIVSLPIGNFEVNSIKITNSSHPFTFETIFDKNYLEIRFDMINLADSSSDEKNSHGFFELRVKPNKDLTYLKSITLGAQIYFDYNSGVATNEAETIIEDFTFTSEFDKVDDNVISIIPNPNHGKFLVTSKIINEFNSIKIIKQDGKPIYYQKFSNPMTNIEINLTKYPCGLYFVLAEGKKKYYKKFIIN